MRRSLLLLLASFVLTGFAQQKHWVFFTDKGELSVYNPTDLLSERALARRAEQNILLDARDFPVRTDYIQQLAQHPLRIHQRSKWLNAVSVSLQGTSPEQLESLPFVREVRPMRSYNRMLGSLEDCPNSEELDRPERQLDMVGIQALHERGFRGEGVLVAVFDNGFFRVDQIPGFQHLFEEQRILATRDFVDGDEDVYHPCAHCRHGTYVFSILAADDSLSGLKGSAYEAEFLLLRTENDASETTQEEDNWVAAAEFADSMGAQVFTTSLGYFDFDQGIGNYHPEDRDGNTSIITRAGDIAASKGIIVVNSAGNEGNQGLIMPADGDSILAIGSVDQCEGYSSFSSIGPSADGRVKPDLAAMGERTFFLNVDGSLARGSGTSFSCPILSGLTACLIQAHPSASNIQIYQALKQSASQASSPDLLLGYGIARGEEALNLLQTRSQEQKLHLYPNPNDGSFAIMLPAGLRDREIQLQVLDLMGRDLSPVHLQHTGKSVRIDLPPTTLSGHYLVRIWAQENPKKRYFQKLSVYSR